MTCVPAYCGSHHPANPSGFLLQVGGLSQEKTNQMLRDTRVIPFPRLTAQENPHWREC